jgi:hypothetical protein
MTPGVFFNEPRTHAPDPYEELKRIEAAERRKNALKVGDAKAFVGMGTTGKTFTKNSTVYFDADIKPITRSNTERLSRSVDHGQAPFKPTSGIKSTKFDTFNKFPEYKPSPLTFARRKPEEE